jgi:hypothetical protein
MRRTVDVKGKKEITHASKKEEKHSPWKDERMKCETSIVILQKEHIDRVVTLASIGTQFEEPTSYSGSRVQPYKDISSSRAQAPEDFLHLQTSSNMKTQNREY